MPSPHDRLRENIDRIAAKLERGETVVFCYQAIRFRNTRERHAYAQAEYRWWNGDRSPEVRAALSNPDISWVYENASGDTREILAKHFQRVTSGNATRVEVGRKRATHLPAETPPEWKLARGSTVTHLSPVTHGLDPAVAVSVMEGVVRQVAAAGGRRDMLAEDWADRAGIPTQNMSRLLLAEAADYGLSMRRHRGHGGRRMIELSLGALDVLDDADADLDGLDVLDRIDTVLNEDRT